MSARPRAAVIGAGLAGTSCARALHDAGWDVVVLEKGRGPGGRTSTRRDGDWRFDHGAPRLELGAAGLDRLREAWEADGVVARWQPRGKALAPAAGDPTWIGVPGASALTSHLARDLDLRASTKVVALVRDATWWIDVESPRGAERVGPFDSVVITAPAPQARALLETAGASALAASLEQARFAPCIAAMIVVRPDREVPFDELRVASGPLASAHRMDHRPGRLAAEGAQAWVLHGSESWSAERLEDDPATAAPELTAAFLREAPGQLIAAHGHRWRYARATERLAAPCLHERSLALGLAGDWFEAGDRGPASSRALLSGLALARALTGATGG